MAGTWHGVDGTAIGSGVESATFYYVMLRGALCPEASLTSNAETLRSQRTLPQGDTFCFLFTTQQYIRQFWRISYYLVRAEFL